MIVLAIAIYMVYNKTIVKFSYKGLIDKSMYSKMLFANIRGKSHFKITLIVFWFQLPSASYIEYSTIV